MKKSIIVWLSVFCIFLSRSVSAQSPFPTFLQGTWKVVNKDSYEHWNQVSDSELKGISYAIKNGQKIISEYLKIRKLGNKVIYSALVIGQNNGKEIDFELSYKDSTYSFSNVAHDFPKHIRYTRLEGDRLHISVEGKSGEGHTFDVHKVINELPSENTNYDGSLANKLGADDYGMKSYIFVLLKTGQNNTTDKQLINESFKGHMENIARLVKNGQLIVAGPFGKNDSSLRGLFILNNIATIEQAKELLQTDPTIKNGLLEPMYYTWYGSAALAEYLPFSEKIWKKAH
ncbi:DUF6265 family protein [Sphingobacterium sp. DR205]|uniref:DUF6265 family protein n=1 Tax=Sphingobacterium sp. DR205 TaxID=2713573 RepID=UPI0013E4B8B5|nr:DUF6265 family protein [Sphingobacterium sp. DR205]QIH33759.1 hypothetical protein G6053_13080 [Sphingobacterium sp. DR205]